MAERPIPTRALALFLLIAFGLAWGLFALFVAFPDRITAVFGPLSASNPLFVLAVYAPAIAALLLVGRYGGVRAYGPFFARLLLWRIPPLWLAVVVLLAPLFAYAGAMIAGAALAAADAPGAAMIRALLFMLVLGPVEELGWRGFALPLLQRVMAPLHAALLLGLIWGLWHLPAFFAEGTPQAGWGFSVFLLGAISVSVIFGALFNATGGSLLWAALFHFQLNNPLWPDGQPWDMLLYPVAAVIVVVLNRDRMLKAQGAVTRVA